MDAEKVANEYRDQYQRIDYLIIKCLPITCTDCIHRHRCLKRLKRSESGEGTSIGMGLVDIILRVLVLTTEGLARVCQ
ncbi:hypothetical protein SDC9_200030 [bioreactor metagenome]|uniref:Uncharacterized protein n=1 Tax=bioreactor metagenome TaxID=1076179 RepID=A0A645IPN1_9ZZZZ